MAARQDQTHIQVGKQREGPKMKRAASVFSALVECVRVPVILAAGVAVLVLLIALVAWDRACGRFPREEND